MDLMRYKALAPSILVLCYKLRRTWEFIFSVLKMLWGNLWVYYSSMERTCGIPLLWGMVSDTWAPNTKGMRAFYASFQRNAQPPAVVGEGDSSAPHPDAPGGTGFFHGESLDLPGATLHRVPSMLPSSSWLVPKWSRAWMVGCGLLSPWSHILWDHPQLSWTWLQCCVTCRWSTSLSAAIFIVPLS